MEELVSGFRQTIRLLREDCDMFYVKFGETETLSNEIPEIAKRIDTVLIEVLTVFDKFKKCLIIETFLNENSEQIIELGKKYLTMFGRQHIRYIRKQIDAFIKHLSSKIDTNLRQCPNMIASIEVLEDFYDVSNDTELNEPIDFTATIKNGLVNIKGSRNVDLRILEVLNAEYTLIFKTRQHFVSIAQFRSDFMRELKKWKSSATFTFIIDNEDVELALQQCSRVSDAKAKIADMMRVNLRSIKIRQNGYLCIDECLLTSFDTAPFHVEYQVPPPSKYHFQTEIKNVSRFYAFGVRVAQVKNDLVEFLKRDVELRVDGEVLKDNQRLSSMNLLQKVIDVISLPGFTVKVNGEVVDCQVVKQTTLLDILRTLKRNCQFFINGNLVHEVSRSLEEIEFTGDRVIEARDTTDILILCKLPNDSIIQLAFNEDSTIETLKTELKHFVPGKCLLNVGEKRLKHLTSQLSRLQLGSLEYVTVTQTDGILLQFAIGADVYELRCRDTMTVADASEKLKRVAPCEFKLFKANGKVMNPEKVLILLSSERIEVRPEPTVYVFQMPNGKFKKKEFDPMLSVEQLKEYLSGVLSKPVDAIQLACSGKKLKSWKFMYRVDPAIPIVISFVTLYDFSLELRNKSSLKRFPFESGATVGDVKANISQRSKCAVERFSMLCEGKLVDDDELLSNLPNHEPFKMIVSPQIVCDIERENGNGELLQQLMELVSEDDELSIRPLVSELCPLWKLVATFFRCGRKLDVMMNNIH